jgi:hypothetical protein
MKRLEFPPGIVAGTEWYDQTDEKRLVRFDYVDRNGFYHKNFTPKMLRIIESLTDEWVDIDLLSDIPGNKHFRNAALKLQDFQLLEIKGRGDVAERACLKDSFFVRAPRQRVARTEDEQRLVALMAALSKISVDGALSALLIDFVAWYDRRQARSEYTPPEQYSCDGCGAKFQRTHPRHKYCTTKCAIEAKRPESARCASPSRRSRNST